MNILYNYVKINDEKYMNPRQKHLLKTHRRKANIKEGPQNLPPITINGIVKCDVISRD